MIAALAPRLLLLAWLAAAAGCSLLHGDYPDRQCQANADCFRAQGEWCERDAGVCRLAADDAGPSGDASAPPDAAPEADAAPMSDAAVDAGAIDGGPDASAASLEPEQRR